MFSVFDKYGSYSTGFVIYGDETRFAWAVNVEKHAIVSQISMAIQIILSVSNYILWVDRVPCFVMRQAHQA